MDRGPGRKLYRETKDNIVLNIVRCHLGLIAYPNIKSLTTSAENFLLCYLDESETRGQITFIPLEFLREYAKERLTVEYKNIPEKEEKEKLFELIKPHIDCEFFNNTYKNVPLHNFRKHILNSALTVTRDNVQVQRTLREAEYIELGFCFEDIAKFTEAFDTNQDEWMYLSQLQDYFKPWSLAFPHLCLLRPFTNSCPVIGKERFSFGIILQRSHFTAYVIDRACPSKTRTRCNVYFFNSGGYVSGAIDGVKSWTVEADFKFKKNNNRIEYNDEVRNVLEMTKQLKIDNVFFNSFQTQHLNSECGGFTSVFLLLVLHNIIDSTTKDSTSPNGKGFDFRNMLYIYNNMYHMGNDLTISMLKGLLFFTTEDLKANKLSKDDYLSSPYIYPICNRKKVEFEELVGKANTIIAEMNIKK